MKSSVILMTILLALALVTADANSLSVQQDASTSSNSKSQPDDKSKKDQKKADEQKGGFFSGTKKVSAAGSQQQGLTATGGTKGVGEEGANIGAVQPNSEHRAFVSAMENYSIPAADLKQFQSDGKLVPAK